ncbi:hypothetical protein PDE_03142 [Penicillium oxalicum 114-2]|uniref:Uncharacterized protein n=1 Tax=Penicillium oxalicum (strain 114-2 / CGMCC 5302) TaxID=933388 RepID=S7ZHM4_PENO1|nr:hypothetical protein PDE_03142 [Penicillium oxalicum 114-2]
MMKCRLITLETKMSDSSFPQTNQADGGGLDWKVREALALPSHLHAKTETSRDEPTLFSPTFIRNSRSSSG